MRFSRNNLAITQFDLNYSKLKSLQHNYIFIYTGGLKSLRILTKRILRRPLVKIQFSKIASVVWLSSDTVIKQFVLVESLFSNTQESNFFPFTSLETSTSNNFHIFLPFHKVNLKCWTWTCLLLGVVRVHIPEMSSHKKADEKWFYILFE